MIASKIAGRLQEIINSSYVDNNEVMYTTDKYGCMVRVERPTFQTKAAREGLKQVRRLDQV